MSSKNQYEPYETSGRPSSGRPSSGQSSRDRPPASRLVPVIKWKCPSCGTGDHGPYDTQCLRCDRQMQQGVEYYEEPRRHRQR